MRKPLEQMTEDDRHARARLLDVLRRRESIGAAEIVEWPFYCATGNSPSGKRVDMVPVNIRMAGCQSSVPTIYLLIDGECKGILPVDGSTATLASFLRQGFWADIGPTLEDTLEAQDGRPVVHEDVSWDCVHPAIRRVIEGE